jgi:hypothetical protein
MAEIMPAIYLEMSSSDYTSNPGYIDTPPYYDPELPLAEQIPPLQFGLTPWRDFDTWWEENVVAFYNFGFRSFIFHGPWGRNRDEDGSVIDYNSWQTVHQANDPQTVAWCENLRDKIHEFATTFPGVVIYIYVGGVRSNAMQAITTEPARTTALYSPMTPFEAYTDWPTPVRYIFDASWSFSAGMTDAEWEEMEQVYDHIGRKYVWGEALPKDDIPRSWGRKSMAIDNTYLQQAKSDSTDLDYDLYSAYEAAENVSTSTAISAGEVIRIGNGTGTAIWIASADDDETVGVENFIADCKRLGQAFALSPGEFLGYGFGSEDVGPDPTTVPYEFKPGPTSYNPTITLSAEPPPGHALRTHPYVRWEEDAGEDAHTPVLYEGNVYDSGKGTWALASGYDLYLPNPVGFDDAVGTFNLEAVLLKTRADLYAILGGAEGSDPIDPTIRGIDDTITGEFPSPTAKEMSQVIKFLRNYHTVRNILVSVNSGLDDVPNWDAMYDAITREYPLL